MQTNERHGQAARNRLIASVVIESVNIKYQIPNTKRNSTDTVKPAE